jgi:LysR family transcriptional regulator for bpeEF and oprC
VDVAVRVGPLRQSGLVARRIAEMTLVSCAAPSYLDAHAEPATPDDLRGHRLLGLRLTNGGPPEWHFPPPYTPRRLKLHFALTFNTVEGPIMAATEGLGICHIAISVGRQCVEHGALRLMLPALCRSAESLVYPSAGHQSARLKCSPVRRGSDAQLCHYGAEQPAAQVGRAARQDTRRRARGRDA